MSSGRQNYAGPIFTIIESGVIFAVAIILFFGLYVSGSPAGFVCIFGVAQLVVSHYILGFESIMLRTDFILDCF